MVIIRDLFDIIQSFSKRSNNFAILLILLFALCFIPKIIFSLSHETDTFAYNHTSLSYVTLQDEALPDQPYLNTGNTVQRLTNSWTSKFIPHAMISGISMVTGIPPEQIQFLPWGGFILIIAAYALAYTLLRSKVYASIFTLFLSYEPVINGLTFNTYQQGWSYLFYFLFLAVIYHIFSKRYEGSSRKIWIQAIFLCILLYIGVFFTYYSSNLYSLLFLLIFLPLIFFSRIKNWKIKLLGLFSIVMTFTLVLLLEPAVWYVLGLRQSDRLTNLPSFIYQYILSVFGLGDAPKGGEGALGLPTSQIVLYLGLFIYILISLPILYHLFRCGLKLIRKKPRIISTQDAFFIAILGTGVLDTLLYFALGIVSYKYILLLFPLLSLIVLHSFARRDPKMKNDTSENKNRKQTKPVSITKRKVFVVIFVFLLISSVGIKFILHFEKNVDKTFEETENGVTWFENYTNVDDDRYLSNLLTGEKLLVQFTRDGYRDMDLFVLRPEKSGFLNKPDFESKEIFNKSHIQYFVISSLDFGGDKDEIKVPNSPLKDYKFLNKVYGDGNIAILYHSG